MNFELFVTSISGPRTAVSIQRAMAQMSHTESIGRWASYRNAATGVAWQCDWSQAHLCWSVPTGRGYFYGVEFARVVGAFCVHHHWRPVQWEPSDGPIPELLLARWGAQNLATLKALGPRLQARKTQPREILLARWAERYFDEPASPLKGPPPWSTTLDEELVAQCTTGVPSHGRAA